MNNKIDLIGIKSLVNLNNDDALLDTYSFLDDEQDTPDDKTPTDTNDIVNSFLNATEDINIINKKKDTSDLDSDVQEPKKNISFAPTPITINNSNLKEQIDNNAYQYKHIPSQRSTYTNNNRTHGSVNLDSDMYKNKYSNNMQQQNTDIVKSYINSTLDDGTNDNVISNAYEDELENKKIDLMDKISELRNILIKKQISIDNVPDITRESSYQEIVYAYKLLQVKNNRNLNINFTNDIIKIGTTLLEKICDGKKSYFGIKPNLVGYTKVVQYQLRDLNIESEQISGEIFNRQSTSPALKIAAAIIPGMFYYATSRSGMATDTNEHIKKNNIDEAMSEIQNIN